MLPPKTAPVGTKIGARKRRQNKRDAIAEKLSMYSLGADFDKLSPAQQRALLANQARLEQKAAHELFKDFKK